nr:PASTA domain-containing protein [Kibdelosporangium phytohabitans]
MPDLVGKKLQEAQDTVQRVSGNPLFLTQSHDAKRKGRQQVVDGNWKVCSQNVAAGTTVNADTVIDFGAVKLEEECD